ncbi:MAG: hypothetical protein AAGA84_04910 [Pseudomonadota bacterium]
MRVAARLIAYGLLICALFGGLLAMQAYLPGGLRMNVASSLAPTLGTSEYSVVEWLQLFLLMVALSAALRANALQVRQMPLGRLLGALAVAAIIRELDLFLDRYLFDQAWQIFVALLIVVLLTYEVRHRRQLVSSIDRAMPSVGLTLIIVGIVIVVVIASVIGTESLWRSLLNEQYTRVAKLAAEELVELLGYALWAVGSLEYLQETAVMNALAPSEDTR